MADGYEITISGLLRKRGEMAAQADDLRARLKETLVALDHLDATIRIFNPNIETCDMPERAIPALHGAHRGELQRFLLHTLREADAAMTTSQLAEASMQSRALDSADRTLRKLIGKRIGMALGRLRKAGFIEGMRHSKGAEMEWSLTGKGG
jgi:formyltetrahydrofolate synthetase